MSADYNQRAAKRGHIRELWSRRPLAGWVKSAANKVLSRRLERKRLQRETLALKGDSHEPQAPSRPRWMDYWVPGAQTTICNDCGNPSLAHSLAVWTEDGASYCPSCRPEIAASPIRKGEQP